MSLERKPAQGLEDHVKRLLDNIPVIGKIRRERQEDKQLQQLLRQTVHKVLQDIQDGGFVQLVPQDSKDDPYEKFYWVTLRRDDETKYYTSFYVIFTGEDRASSFSLEIFESTSSSINRQFSLGATQIDTSQKFFCPGWEGIVSLFMERVNDEKRGKSLRN